ncbi:MAG: DUF4118 domain-containing protein [Candidatus Obscuribacterales bacterium]|nr:DUF4118 domain-containing protein [Candidatus Obscuribacterales bacterium]
MNSLVKEPINFSNRRLSYVLQLARTVNLAHLKELAWQYSISTLTIAAVTLGCFLGGVWISDIDAIMLYFAATYLLAYRSTLGPALWAGVFSIFCLDYFLTPPVFHLEFAHAHALAAMLLMIILTSRSAARIRKYALNLEEMVSDRTSQLEESNKQLSIEVAKHKSTEEKLRRTVSELGRSNAMLQQFARIASHDLQEPLRVIQGYVGLLNSRYKEKLDDNGKDFLGYISDGSKRMEGLIRGILDHASVSTNSRRFEIVEIKHALADACANLEQRIEETGAQVTYDNLPSLTVNKVQMTQLFQNLIANALKFQKGDEAPRIHISCKADERNYVFSVADNGIGIEAEYQEQIFDMFKRLHSSQQFPGSGLGLAICKAIVDHHGGRIWVESETQKGSRFCFSIPRS